MPGRRCPARRSAEDVDAVGSAVQERPSHRATERARPEALTSCSTPPH